jgi:hypothetical protein
MKISIFQVDAFAKEAFSGNPAAVCPLDYWGRLLSNSMVYATNGSGFMWTCNIGKCLGDNE